VKETVEGESVEKDSRLEAVRRVVMNLSMVILPLCAIKGHVS
jgi:hypothetical protein